MADDEQDRPPAAERPTRSDQSRPESAPGDATLPFTRLGDFELLREIGRGGMGVVYEARQLSLKRRIALKVLPPGLGLTDQAVQRFEREAQAAAKLHHNNIVPVHATGRDQGCHFYAMELVEGQTLSRVLDDLRGERTNPLMEATVTDLAAGSPDPRAGGADGVAEPTSLSDTDTGGRRWFDTVAQLVADVSDALHYAHDRGVIHRDVKPANLMMSTDGRLCLGDFGLARVAQEPGMTVSGSFLGTPAYMSPEQVAAGRVTLDHRTDVYSLGAVLYEMLTLQRPFQGDSREQILTGILSKDPRPPRRINPRVPVDLETICLKAMEKDPDRRYATAGEMAADLRQYLQRGLIAARRAGLVRRAGKFVRRHQLATVTAVALLVVAVLTLVTWTASSGQSREAALRAFADARYYQSLGEYERGLESVDAALAQSPDLAEAKLLRARLLMELRRYDEAVATAQGMLDADADDWTGHLILALAANTPEASLPASQISVDGHRAAVERLAPETADAYHLRALAVSDDDAAAAIDLLDRALAIDPSHAEALAERSRHHAYVKNFDAALRDTDRLIAVRPRSAQGHRLAGRHYVELHDTERALEQFAQALRIDPDDPITLNERALLYRGLGRHDEALADLDLAIELDADYPRSYYERARLQGGMGRHDEALEDARKAIELQPDYEVAEVFLFNTLFGMGRTEELAEVMRRWEETALENDTVDPEDRAGLHHARAWFRLAQQQPQAAIEETERAIELMPEYWYGYINRAGFRRRMGDVTGADGDCRRAAEFQLKQPPELLMRGRLMFWGGMCDFEELAAADFTRAIEIAPWWSDPYLWRAGAWIGERNYDEALADLDRAIERAPAWGVAYFRRGDLHLRRERFELALADLEQAAELGLGISQFPEAREVGLLQRRVHVRNRLGRVEEGLAIYDAALRDRPDWIEAHWQKVDSLMRLGRLEEAREAADAGIARFAESGNPMTIAFRLFRAALRAEGSGDCEGAREDLEAVERLAETIFWGADLRAALAAVHVGTLRATCPELYDGARSLEWTRVALANTWEDVEFRRTLGALLYHEGELDEALEVLERLDEEQDLEQPWELFYLAMTYFKLGREADARRCHDRAMVRLEATFPDEPAARRAHREAAELLGLELPYGFE